MTQASEALVRRILGETIDPHTGAPLADSLRAVGVDGARVSIDLQLGSPAAGAAEVMAVVIAAMATTRYASTTGAAAARSEGLEGRAARRNTIPRMRCPGP